MPFKTILSITGVHQGDGDLTLAAGLCEQSGAHLSVFVVALAAPPPIGRYAAAFSDAWLEERQADMKELERRVAAVTHFLADKGVPADVASEYAEQAWADESIGRRARYSDLVVIGPELLGGELLKAKVIDGVLFSSGRPLLLVPSTASPTLAPKRIVVGWDAGLEAARAVREALGILTRAEVHLAVVDPAEGENGHGQEPGADVAAFLARHGVKIVVDRLPSEGRPIADVLKRYAVDRAAEILVMGAYGHSRLRERVLGGVTKAMLDEPPVPVFMAR